MDPDDSDEESFDDLRRDNEKPISIKVVLAGDSGVGKSNLLSQYCFNKFTYEEKSTIGMEFGSKKIRLKGDGQRIHIRIWDTAGQERFRSVTKAYYRDAHVCLLVYDVTAARTLEHIPTWLSDVRDNARFGIVLGLIGNKIDLQSDIPDGAAEALADKEGMMSCLTSAQTTEGVSAAFRRVVRHVYRTEMLPKLRQTAKGNVLNSQQKAPLNTKVSVSADSAIGSGGQSKGCCG